MSSVKRVGSGSSSSKSSRAKAEVEELVAEMQDSLGTKKKGKTTSKGAKAALEERKKVESTFEALGDTVWLHNVSGTEFHVPPVSFKPDDADTAVAFELGQVLPFEKAEVLNKRFKKCILDGKLTIVDEENAFDIEERRHAISEKGTEKKAGLAESGLPVSYKRAIDYIWESEDIDELEQYLDLEDREEIQMALERRIEELESELD